MTEKRGKGRDVTGGSGKSEDLQGIQAARGGMPAANFSKNMRKTRPLFLNRPSLYGQHKKEPLVGNIEF